MAIDYKQLNEELNNTPLNDDELRAIQKVEDHIDKVIKSSFYGEPIRIPLDIPMFYYFKICEYTPMSSTRRFLMYAELKRRYDKAGWNCIEDIDDGLDGPNRSGIDYWVLTGK